MIDPLKLQQFSEILSQLPCPDCGGTHPVQFRLNSTHSLVDSQLLVSDFPDPDTCEGFKLKVKDFFIKHQHLLHRDPFANIK